MRGRKNRRSGADLSATVIDIDSQKMREESESSFEADFRSPVPLLPRDSMASGRYMSNGAQFSPLMSSSSEYSRPMNRVKAFFRRHLPQVSILVALLFFVSLGILGIGISKYSATWGSVGQSLLDKRNRQVPKERATILQFNDIYELIQINGRGGLSRAIAQRKKFLKANPGNTIVIFAGDLFSPSALSTATYPPSPKHTINGMQMVNVTNLLFDLATFGNHEFDLKESALTQRLWESKYLWIATNLESRAFPVSKVHPYIIRKLANINFAFIGVCVDTVMPSYVKIQNMTRTIETVRPLVRDLKENHDVDFVVAITHLDFKQDIALVQEHLGIDLVLGGHNHENMYYKVSKDLVPITKADANAKSFYVHEIYKKRDPYLWDIESNYSIRSDLIPITENMPTDPEADSLIDYWWQMAKASFAQQGFHLEKKITRIPENECWDARNIIIRNGPSAVTGIVAESMKYCAKRANLYNLTAAFFNTGMIRMDDVQGPGDVSTYDILRLLPYPNVMAAIDVNGRTLLEMFEISRTQNTLLGGFMHLSKEFDPICMDKHAPANANVADSPCTLRGKPIELDKFYTFVTNKFLLGGTERNLPLLSPKNNQGIRLIRDTNIDFRKCLIAYLTYQNKKNTVSQGES